jgi:chromosome segregation ATPase
LDYKIQELKHQIEPREHEIEELGKQIGNMDEELEQYHRINIDLDQTLADLRFKVKTAEKELNKEKEQVKIAGNIVKRFKIDLTDCIQHVEEPRKFKVNDLCEIPEIHI